MDLLQALQYLFVLPAVDLSVLPRHYSLPIVTAHWKANHFQRIQKQYWYHCCPHQHLISHLIPDRLHLHFLQNDPLPADWKPGYLQALQAVRSERQLQATRSRPKPQAVRLEQQLLAVHWKQEPQAVLLPQCSLPH